MSGQQQQTASHSEVPSTAQCTWMFSSPSAPQLPETQGPLAKTPSLDPGTAPSPAEHSPKLGGQHSDISRWSTSVPEPQPDTSPGLPRPNSACGPKKPEVHQALRVLEEGEPQEHPRLIHLTGRVPHTRSFIPQGQKGYVGRQQCQRGKTGKVGSPVSTRRDSEQRARARHNPCAPLGVASKQTRIEASLGEEGCPSPTRLGDLWSLLGKPALRWN